MAGNYRSQGSGISKAIGGAVRAARSAHVKKHTLAKQTEAAKSVVSHKEAVKGDQARQTLQTKAKAVISIVKEKGSQARRTVTHKAKVKAKEATKRKKLAKDEKW